MYWSDIGGGRMKNKTFYFVKYIVGIFLVLHIICPLFAMLTHISFDDIEEVLTSAQFKPMLWNSIFSSFVAAVISVALALLLAWCVNRTGIRHKGIWSVIFTLPMLIPSISHGMGLSLLFGDNGFFTNMMGINIHLYGLTGIVIGATLYSCPMAFLMLTDSFQYEDYTVYEVADVLGLSKQQQFCAITLSNLKKPLISAFFAVFTVVFTDYGVPLAVGGKMTTLPVYMYREVIGLLDYSKGGIIGAVLLVPAIIAFIIDLANKENGSGSTVTKTFAVKKNGKRDAFANIVCGITLLFISLPIITFVVLGFVKQYPVDYSFTFDNIREALELGIWGYLLNSLFLALTTALLGTLIAYYAAYVTARSKRNFSSVAIHLISLITLSFPGLVLGLSYVLFFQGSFIYGTIAILVTVNITHFFASPYLMAYNSLLKFNYNLEDVAYSLGISKVRILLDVYMPCTRGTILEMFSYIFVNCMVTISAISFLTNYRNMPLALLIPQFDTQSMLEPIAFISIIILLVNMLEKGAIYFLKLYFVKKEEGR